MFPRLFLLVALLASLLSGCVTTTGGGDIERMERNQRNARETAA
jgi:predicted small secreted protein